MAIDEGIVAQIEEAIVTMLTAATVDSKVVFKVVDHWGFQIDSLGDWKKNSPFAFVQYIGTPNTSVEGDHDLNQHMQFQIAIGVERMKGPKEVARVGAGETKHLLGISRLRDIVITALQEQIPTGVSGVEYLEFISDRLDVSVPNRCALNMIFRIDYTKCY